MSVANVEVTVPPVAGSDLAAEQRERLRLARISSEETQDVEAVMPTARMPVAGKAAWRGGPRRPTFQTDPAHSTVELPQIERYDVHVTRTRALIEAEVLRFWQERKRRPVAVCLSPLRLLTVRSGYWRRYPVLLLESTIEVELISLPDMGDDEVGAVSGEIGPNSYL